MANPIFNFEINIAYGRYHDNGLPFDLRASPQLLSTGFAPFSRLPMSCLVGELEQLIPAQTELS
jgi:hypothetical protein